MDSITKNGLQSLAVDGWNGEGDLATFTTGFVAAWSERSALANVTLEAKDKRIAELEAALHKICDDVNYWFAVENQLPRDLLAGIEWECTLGLYGKAPHELDGSEA
jgi:hypothetical protein